MSEGRRTQVVLLDDRRLDIVVQPKLTVVELTNIVASHCNLKDPDKRYFGLAYLDERQQYHWLHNDRRVLDHDYPRKLLLSGATLILYHLPKFYVESITQVAHAASVELLFLHVRMQLLKGLVEADNATLCHLGAYSMQAYFGDFTDVSTARNQMRRLFLFPPRISNDALLLVQCEDRVLNAYPQHRGVSKGEAIMNFMTTAERLQTYGIQAFEVQDKAGVQLTLAISSRGIFQYDLNALDKPRRVFYWKQLENLYYRDRKFSIEINDIGRVVHTLSSFNVYEEVIQEPAEDYDDLTEAISDPSTQVSVSRRAFLPSGIYVHVFWCETAQLCKTLWSFAIAQHQFYLDRKAAAKKGWPATHQSNEELAAKLDRLSEEGGSAVSTYCEDSDSGLGRLAPSLSSVSLRSFPGSERSEEERQKDAEAYKKLKARKQELEQLLVERLRALKEVCVREGELTGQLPSEMQRALAPGETAPKIKRRVGTSFSITSETVTKHRKADQVARLEADVDVHRKIVAAALKLANDSSANKSVRRKRRRDYEAARHRLREMEQRLHQLRISSSKPDLPNALLTSDHSRLSENGDSLRVCKSLPSTPHGSTRDLTAPSGGPAVARARRPPTGRPPVSPALPSSPVGRTGSFPAERSSPTADSHAAAVQGSSQSPPLQPRTAESVYDSPTPQSPPRHHRAACANDVTPEHSLGAYNVPNQRTSWDHACLSTISSGVLAALLRESKESLSIDSPHSPSGLMPKHSMNGYINKRPFADFSTGSLDRRVLGQRQRDTRLQRIVHCAPDTNGVDSWPASLLAELEADAAGEHRPSTRPVRARCDDADIAAACSPRESYLPNGCSVETVKPYETADLIKYGANSVSQPTRSFGSPKGAEMWWTSKLATAARKNYVPFPLKPAGGCSGDTNAPRPTNGSVLVDETHCPFPWYNDPRPGAPCKAPTIV